MIDKNRLAEKRFPCRAVPFDEVKLTDRILYGYNVWWVYEITMMPDVTMSGALEPFSQRRMITLNWDTNYVYSDDRFINTRICLHRKDHEFLYVLDESEDLQV